MCAWGSLGSPERIRTECKTATGDQQPPMGVTSYLCLFCMISPSLSHSWEGRPVRCTSACYTAVLYTRDYIPLLLKVKINAQLGHFKRNLSLTFPCYLGGHLVNIDEFKCTSCLSRKHSTLTSLVDALFASKQVIGCRVNVSERMLEWNGRSWQSLFNCLRFNVLSGSSLLLLCMQINQCVCACQKQPGINKKQFPLCLSFISK